MDKTYFYNRWEEAIKPFAQDSHNGETVFNEIILAYSEPGRYFHNLDHIRFMLDLIEQYRPLLTQPIEIALATWYHDVIYDVSRSGDGA